MDPEPSDQFVQSFARGLAVIRTFDADHPRMTLSEVAERTGLTRAAARRFLHTLLGLGYVISDGRSFLLTPRVLELGFSYLSGLSLPELAQPYLEELSSTLGESTSASVLDGGDIVYVARVPTKRIMNVGITIGTRFPAHATSMGRVLLAFLRPAELNLSLANLEAGQHTERSITEPEAFRAMLGEVRDQGWALVDQELEIGLRSIAAPVRGPDGSVIAAVNVAGAVGTASLDRILEVYRPALLNATDQIEDAIRHTSPLSANGISH
ncbi:IclR family transcriptional regulator C-terminal domain-containing protein [Cryobacterium sp. Y11]|uniref:IclR family transcriptional regulator domain-containing protein n=1 Tax=Cryobacterium sp. Y11 TaxID=2045016 RepID=UPI000CE55DBE|nr:IclR family transcriptional regulator C-terminal domain-containing protein [Cryobacterium sp. Y11]